MSALLKHFRRVRTPLEFLNRNEPTLRRLAAEERARGEFSAWLSRVIERLDERNQIEDPSK